MPLGRGTVLVWKPDEVIDDATIESLDADLGFVDIPEYRNNSRTERAVKLESGCTVRKLNLKRTNNLVRSITYKWHACIQMHTGKDLRGTPKL